MKKIIKGWIGKDDTSFIGEDLMLLTGEIALHLPTIYKVKGSKNSWLYEDWPPIKIKITIETGGDKND